MGLENNRIYCGGIMKTILFLSSFLLLSGCQIETLYFYDEPITENYGLEINHENSHQLGQSISYLEELSLFPFEMASNPDEFLYSSGALTAVTPVVELINIVGDSFFPWYEWQNIDCSVVISDNYGTIVDGFWQQQGEITGTWDAKNCYDNNHNEIRFHGDLVTHTDWVTEDYSSEVSELFGASRLSWLLESEAGSIRLLESELSLETLFWGDLSAEFDLLFNIETHEQNGLLSIKTIEPLIFENRAANATQGWIQFKSDDHKLDVFMMHDGIRLVLDGGWLADYS